MKKFYTILSSAFLLGSLNAQVYLGKDFEDQDIYSGGFTDQTIVGTSDWFAASFNNNNFAKMTNFSGGANSPSETWYITPAVDLTSATSPIFSFASSANFNGSDIEVFTSVNYDGTSDPNTQGTWAALSPVLSAGSYNWVNSGELAVTNTSATTYFAFKYTGTASDGKTWQIDSIFVAEAGEAFQTTVVVTPPSTVSIYDIQYTTAVPANSPYMGQNVNTGGIVTHVRSDNKGWYMSSGTGPWSGIYVYSTLNPAPVAVGDSVTLTAEVVEFNELTELSFPNNIVVVSSGNFVEVTPVPTGSILSEPYEGCFISTCGICTAADNNFGDWSINDGTGDAEVGDFFFTNTGTQGTTYNVKGIVDFAFGYFGFLPRNGSDVQTTLVCDPISVNENNVVYNVYPNPTNNELNIEVEGNHNVSILDINGKVMLNQITNGFTTIDVSGLASGMYLINVEGNMTKFIKN